MQLPRQIFEQQLAGTSQVANEGQAFHLIEKVEFNKGVQVWIRGAHHYQKGMATAETLFALNIAKRLIIQFTRIGAKWWLFPSFILIGMLPHKLRLNAIQGILEAYNEVMWKLLNPFILKPEFMVDSSNELLNFIRNFLSFYGVNLQNSILFAKLFSHLIEYDNAYRYRMQDLLTAISQEDLYNKPIRTINKMGVVLTERDESNVAIKFKRIFKIFSLLLLMPRFRKAFKKAVKLSDFKRLQFDEIDEYWVSMRTDYNYYGEDVETRSKRNKRKGKKIPQAISRQEYEDLIKNKK